MAKARTREELETAVGSVGFTPAARDVVGLIELVLGADEAIADKAATALLRVGTAAGEAILGGFDASMPPGRARLCAVVGRLAVEGDPRLRSWLSERLADSDERTRRRAATALGKIVDGAAEEPLIAAWSRAQSLAERRVIAEALGKIGSSAAIPNLRAVSAEPELRGVIEEAIARIERDVLRATESTIDLDALPPAPFEIALHGKPGLELVLADELAALVRVDLRAVRPGRVATTWNESLRRLFSIRTFSSLAFSPAPERVRGSGVDALVDATVAVLGRPETVELLVALTRGPVRFRLRWAGGGHRRSATRQVGEALRRARIPLVNDSRQAPWEAVVHELDDGRTKRVRIELVPRAISDPRFAYRVATVPAASHPTVAAALAYTAGARRDDVVWDPFVGCGTELVERARIGPYRRLLGTDLDPAALAAARDNLIAAGIEPVLELADARTHRPSEPVTLLLTNPPLGHRVGDPEQAASLLRTLLDRRRELLATGARIVWISPAPENTAAHARARGFSVRLRRPLDLGGIAGELQDLRLDG